MEKCSFFIQFLDRYYLKTVIKNIPKLFNIYGDFGGAHQDVVKALNDEKVRSNVQISQFDGEFKINAVLGDDRKTLTFYGAANSIETLKWKSDGL